MRRPLLLDLFCGAGGAGAGYDRAGWDVVGVDAVPQPRYPFDFVQADAMSFPLDGFDAVHASPLCRDWTALSYRAGLTGSAWMLAATRDRLTSWGGLWVIENVPGARMRKDLVLCGGTFGLRTYRHRWFEFAAAGLLLARPPHPRHRIKTSSKKRTVDWAAGMHTSVTGDVTQSVAAAALGIDWMTGPELAQAIPPAYTEFVGAQLLDHLRAMREAS